MSFFCFTGGARKRRRSRDIDNEKFATSTLLKSEGKFEQWRAQGLLRNDLAVICWTAAFSALDTETRSSFQEFAQNHMGEAEFAIACADSLTGKAREFAVYNLPSFHVFHRGTLVERIEGLSRLIDLGPILEYHMESTLSAGVSSTICYDTPSSHPGADLESRGDQGNTEIQNESCAKPCHRSHPSLTSEPESLGSCESDRTCQGNESTHKGVSRDSQDPVSTTRSYLPRFVKNRSLSLSKRNWEPHTEFGVYQFR